jgi:hypothetical protein
MMPPWKMFAAAFAALFAACIFLISLPYLGGAGAWNFGNFFQGQKGGAHAVVALYPTHQLALAPEGPLHVTSPGFSLESFSGTVSADFSSGSAALSEHGSKLSVRSGLAGLALRGAYLPKIEFSGVRFSVSSDKLNISADNGTISMTGFTGNVSFTGSGMVLDGGFSSVRGDKWEIK